MSKVILSFIFTPVWDFQPDDPTGSITLDRDETKSTSSASVLESHPENDIGALFQNSIFLSIYLFFSWAFWTVSRLLSAELVLVAFFAAVPLWKRVSVCTWYKKTFLGGFLFLLALHLVAMYGWKPISQPQKFAFSRHIYKGPLFQKEPPFYLKLVLKLRPWLPFHYSFHFNLLSFRQSLHVTVPASLFFSKCFHTNDELADDSSIAKTGCFSDLGLFSSCASGTNNSNNETKFEHRWTNTFIRIFDLFISPLIISENFVRQSMRVMEMEWKEKLDQSSKLTKERERERTRFWQRWR